MELRPRNTDEHIDSNMFILKVGSSSESSIFVLRSTIKSWIVQGGDTNIHPSNLEGEVSKPGDNFSSSHLGNKNVTKNQMKISTIIPGWPECWLRRPCEQVLHNVQDETCTRSAWTRPRQTPVQGLPGKQFWINQKMGHTICVNLALVNIFSLRYSIQGSFLANVESILLDMLGTGWKRFFLFSYF